ncbi:MAG: hypothetical protein A2902_04715 [Elusimicrobia bacterium RIFCSPLOWO2_01_FULL_64_13]|nr:MAG: hypothetical protein A2902_04715 [Elusimicrobia bacterium RIFCSPLOWO2_01_FULL_64_13]
MKRYLPGILALGLLAGPAAAEEAVRAGAAKVNITPAVETFKDSNGNGKFDPGEPFADLNGNGLWDPVWIAGYQKERFALGAHDDLWVRCLALVRGKTTLLLISVDSIGVLFDDAALAKGLIRDELGISPENVIIAATHDHSGPDTIGLWGEGDKSGKDPEYLRSLRRKILECAGAAVKDVRPARFAFGRTRYSNVIEDSRPPKVINDLLLSVRIADEEGRGIATLVNYAMHAEVLNGRNRFLTSDYPGVLREKLEDKFGGVGIFFPGDIGGMQSPWVLFHTFWTRGRVGSVLADKVIGSLKNQALLPVTDLSLSSEDLLLPVDNPRFLRAIQAGLFGDSALYAKKEGETVRLPARVVLVRLGPALIATVPGELFPELGNVFRERMAGEYKFLFGLADNEIGYIVPEDGWREDGYEEGMSLGPKTGVLLLDAFTRVLPPRQ